MASNPPHPQSPLRPWHFGAFLGSLLVGLLGGLLFIVILWLLTLFTPLGEALAVYGDKTAWYLTRATGTVAYLLLSASTIWGLLLSTRLIKEAVPAPLTLAMHNVLSWLAVGMAGFHGFILLFDSYYTYQLRDLVVPFMGPYRPGWVGLGVLGSYLILLTSVSFSFRKQLGQRRWRQLHYLTFVAYGLVTLHGLMAGTDSVDPGMRLVYLGSSALIIFLTLFRILAAVDQSEGRRARP